MPRIALRPRPPIIASLSLFALVVILGPRPVAVPLEPAPMGPAPKCIVSGERHGELYLPDPGWRTSQPPILDVDTLVSGLKQLLATPRT
jgi:hypothetical protein